MNTRFANNDEINRWNDLIVSNPDGGNVLQTKEFTRVKLLNGWSARFIVGDKLYIMALEKKVPCVGRFWYIPKGPGINNADQLCKVIPDLKDFAKQNEIVFLRLEPELIKSDDNKTAIKKMGLIPSTGIQIPNTILLDISGDADAILASFSSKTRYNIRAAQKAGVQTQIVAINDKNCDIFYKLMIETIQGRAFLRKYEYFKTFWQSHFSAGTGVFLFAFFEGKVISTDFISILGNKATRKDAASTKDRTVRGASALLELEAIKYLKQRGITSYDLCGSPPSDQIDNHNHPFYGVGVFKSGFNEHVTDYIGCCDLVINEHAYKLWNKFIEKLTKKLYFWFKHDLYF